MDIIKALKDEQNSVRIKNGDKWLVWYENCYCVFRRGYGERKTRTLIETDNFSNALDILMDNE